MSEHRKRQREFQDRIANLDKVHETRLLKLKGATAEEVSNFSLVTAAYRFEREHFTMELEVLEAARLIEKARKVGQVTIAPIESYPPTDIYDPNMRDVHPRPYFTDENKTKMRKWILEARREKWRKWIEVLSPLATILISLIALVVSVIAMYRSSR